MWIVGVCMCILCVFVCMWLLICIYVCMCCCQTSSIQCLKDPCCCEEKVSIGIWRPATPTHPSTFYFLINLHFSQHYFVALLHHHWQWRLVPAQDQRYFICSIVSGHCSIVKEIEQLWSISQCRISFCFICLVCAFLLLIDWGRIMLSRCVEGKTYPASVSNKQRNNSCNDTRDNSIGVVVLRGYPLCGRGRSSWGCQTNTTN